MSAGVRDCIVCKGQGLIPRGCGAYTVCVPCQGRGVLVVKDLPAGGAGVPSTGQRLDRSRKGGEKEELKLRRKLLAVVSLLLSCSAEHATKPSEDASVPIRGHVEVDALAAEVGQKDLGPEMALGSDASGQDAVRGSQAFDAIWELPICGDLNNQAWVEKWPALECTGGDAGGMGMIRLPARGGRLFSCWAGKPVSAALPCYMPTITFDSQTGVTEHVRVNDCRECVQ